MARAAFVVRGHYPGHWRELFCCIAAKAGEVKPPTPGSHAIFQCIRAHLRRCMLLSVRGHGRLLALLASPRPLLMARCLPNHYFTGGLRHCISLQQSCIGSEGFPPQHGSKRCLGALFQGAGTVNYHCQPLPPRSKNESCSKRCLRIPVFRRPTDPTVPIFYRYLIGHHKSLSISIVIVEGTILEKRKRRTTLIFQLLYIRAE